MNAIEIRNLTKSFSQKQAVNDLNMTVPVGAIYGFVGENGSGKSTTEKLICGLLTKNQGEIKLFDKDYKDQSVRSKIGCLIETPGCFENSSVWNNMLFQASNLGIKNKREEVAKVLKIVRMEGSASNKFKNCSLGMKQRIGIAMALLGNPKLLVLDEPINGLDADGMRIMREVLLDISQNYNCTVLISSHILGELEKIATHYGIIKDGKMIVEMTAQELDEKCPIYVYLKSKDNDKTKFVLSKKYKNIQENNGFLIIQDTKSVDEVIKFLYKNGIVVSEIKSKKISLEEYYINLMDERRN